MGKKVVTSIKIDEDILKEAKKLGLVISRIAENAVKRYVYVLKKSGACDFIEEEGHIGNQPRRVRGFRKSGLSLS